MKWYNKEFLSLLAVSVTGLIVAYLSMLTDQLIASHLLENEAFAGIGLSQPLMHLSETFCSIFYVGAAVRFFAAKSAGGGRAIRTVFSTALFAALIGGAIYGISIYGNRWSIAEFFGAEELVTYYCTGYLKYFAAQVALLPVYAVLTELLMCEEDVVLCVCSLFAQLIVNAVVSYLLCPSMGVEGIALGSVIACVASIAILSLHFFRKDNVLKAGIVFSPAEFRKMTVSSVGDMAFPFFQAVMAASVMKLITLRFGDETAPIATLMVDIASLGMIFEALGYAVEPVLGKTYAEKDFTSLRGVVKTATLSMVALALVVGGWLMIAPHSVLALLDIELEEFAKETIEVVRLSGGMLLAIGFVNLYNTCYQYVGHPFVSFFLTFAGTLAGPLAAVLCCPVEKGVGGFAAAYAIGPYIGIGLFLLFVFLFRRGRTFPLLISEDGSGPDENAKFATHRRFPFKVTRARIAIAGLVVFSAVMSVMYSISARSEAWDVEWAFDNLEKRFHAFDRAGLDADQLRYQVTNTCVIADCGGAYLLAEDGETFDCPDEEFNGANAFERGFDRAAIDTGRTFECISYGMRSSYRIITVGGRRIIFWIADFEIYWDTETNMAIMGILLMIIIAAIVFTAASHLENKNEN